MEPEPVRLKGITEEKRNHESGEHAQEDHPPHALEKYLDDMEIRGGIPSGDSPDKKIIFCQQVIAGKPCHAPEQGDNQDPVSLISRHSVFLTYP